MFLISTKTLSNSIFVLSPDSLGPDFENKAIAKDRYSGSANEYFPELESYLTS